MAEDADQDKAENMVARESEEELSDQELGDVAAGGLSLNFGSNKPTYIPQQGSGTP